MSEHAPEIIKPSEASPEQELLLTAHAEQAKDQAEKAPKPAEALRDARYNVDHQARAESGPSPLEKHLAAESAAQPVQPTHINRQLKQITLRRELQQIRRKLPAPQRALSRVIHQPLVRLVSAAASGTVSRPSGLLGGGLTAFIGTTSYLYLAKHFGFTYNYLVFGLLFVGGFAVGLAIELVVNLTISRRAQD